MILSIDPRLKKPKTLLLKVERIQRDPKSKTGDWLIDLSYESELGSVGIHEMWHSFHEGRRYEFSSAGLVLLRQSRFNWLKNISKRSFLKKGKQIRLTTLQWLQLSIYEEIKVPQGLTKEAVESRRLLEELKLLQSDEMISLEGLKSELRPYQETGLRWLWFLYAHGLSGLLCDEMGLGKTHQAMALLAAVFNASSTSHHKYLVVCPTSVIYHWQELLKRFFPKLRAYLFYGQQREMVDFEEHYDLLLTSYGMLRSEKKQLSSLSFEIAIFDEIQVAKNTHSQTHKALGQIKAKMRLGLTGTPIENRLTELKALFDLILPNYMPQEAMFREFFVYPIERNQDPEKKMLLSKLIKPFLLRRKKSEVLLELPEKVEEISYCDLSDEQRELYKEIYRAQREGLYTALKDGQTAPSSLHVFALLNKLKQICDHPCLINKQLQDYQKHESGKWNLFVELLQEARDSGQKLVVFSQYLDMLDIIENYLTEKGIGFAGIRGSTRARKEQLEKFREDPSCEVFVASLQAAGVGVDLVSASVVVHYDRWWNPAKENQATDRVHRIGQSRGVQVFKFVTKGTIEEHIHRLIEKKLTLMEGVVGFDDQDQIKALDRKELLELLKLLDQDIQNVT
jgi:SNF2 family DNA or RNA helicase